VISPLVVGSSPTGGATMLFWYKRARTANSRRVESFLLRSTVVVPFFLGALTTATTTAPGKRLAGLQEVL